MLAAYTARPFTDFGDHNIRNAQVIKTYGCRHNIHNRIDGTHFMKMDFVYGFIMSLRLRFGKNFEYLLGKLPCSVRHCQTVDDLVNVV